MKEIAQIRKLSLWIFLIPFIGINLCLLISVNSSLLENTFFTVDHIGRSNFTIPYLDGSLSISRASRTFPQYLIFKPAMILTSIMLYFYWKNNNALINILNNSSFNYKFKTFGILSAIFLAIHSILLGVEFDLKLFKFLRRVVLLGFIIFEIIAQALLVYSLYKLKEIIENKISKIVLKFKIVLVSSLSIVAIFSIPLLIVKGNIHFKHGLEWNFFIGVILFYLLTRFFWKRTT
tara:strand:+ start:71 stop:772 length:702 start_codon:yes stop_codon:yes gene_type:complete